MSPRAVGLVAALLLAGCAAARPVPSATPLHLYTVEAFDGALRASTAAAQAPRSIAAPQPTLEIPIGASRPVSCALHRGGVDLSKVLRGTLKLLETYRVEARQAAVGTEGARLIFSFELRYSDPSGPQGVIKAALATGSAGSLLCTLADPATDGRHDAAFTRAVGTLFRTASDFSEQPARFVEVWLAERGFGGHFGAVRRLTDLEGGLVRGNLLSVSARVEDGRVRLVETSQVFEANAQGEIERGSIETRTEDPARDLLTVFERTGPLEYAVAVQAAGSDATPVPVRTAAPLTHFLDQAARLRTLASFPESKPLGFLEWGGLSVPRSAVVVRQREARRTGPRSVELTSKDDTERCSLAAVGACERVEIVSGGETLVLLRTGVSGQP